MADDLTGLQVVEKITEANKQFKEDVVAKAVAEVDKVTAEIKKWEAQVADLNKDLTAKGATIGQMVEEIKELKSMKGRLIQMGSQAQKTVIDLMKDEFSKKEFTDIFSMMGKSAEANIYGKEFKMETKVSTVTTGSLTTNYLTYLPWQQGMEPLGQTRIRQFVNTIESDTDNVQFPVANIPPGAGSFSSQTTEGNLKAQVDRGWTMTSLSLYPFAGWVAVSRQSLRNILFLQTWLPTSLNEQLLDQEDLMFANALVAAATGSTSTTGVTSSSTTTGEILIAYVRNLIQKKFKPNLVAIDPVKWSSLLVTKPSNYSLPNVINITPDGQVRILNIPIEPVNWLTGNRCLVGDFTKASIVQSEGLTFRQSENGTSQDFMKNVVTFLLERTEGLAIFRADAFITAVLP